MVSISETASIEVMERAMFGYDHWKLASDPQDDEEPVEEEAQEPEVTEIWDGGRSKYIHVVTFASGRKFHVIGPACSGPFVGDYWITGPDFYADGYASVEAALSYLTDIEHWDW